MFVNFKKIAFPHHTVTLRPHRFAKVKHFSSFLASGSVWEFSHPVSITNHKATQFKFQEGWSKDIQLIIVQSEGSLSHHAIT